MFPIRALSSFCEQEESSDDEILVDYEKIVIDEYTRALKLQREKSNDSAINLFESLLKTEILRNVTSDRKENANVYQIKYGCLKQLGFLHQQLGANECAIENFLLAYEMDNSDVYMLNELGKIALAMHKLPLASFAFSECLRYNQNHFVAGDGLLQCLFMEENYVEAYGWALHMISKDAEYARGHHVIRYLRGVFQSTLPFIESCFDMKYIPNKQQQARTNNDGFTCQIVCDESSTIESPSIPASCMSLKLTQLTWMSIADFLIALDAHCMVMNYKSAPIFNFDDMLVDSLRADVLSEVASDNGEQVEPKLQRSANNQRRKYSKSRIKSSDTAADGTRAFELLLLPTIFGEHFEFQISEDEIISETSHMPNFKRPRISISAIEFHRLSQPLFKKFLEELREEPHTLYSIIFKWLEAIEILGSRVIPLDILQKFMILFDLHLKYTDINSWHHLDETVLHATLLMSVFYLELRVDDHINLCQSIDSYGLVELLDKVLFLSPWIAAYDAADLLSERLIWLQYCVTRYIIGDVDRAIDCLKPLQGLLIRGNQLVLLNQTHNNIIDLENVQKSIQYRLNRTNLESAIELYEHGEYVRLAEVLIASLRGSTQTPVLSFIAQFEMLLEALWCCNEPDLVIQWSGRYIHFAVNHILTIKSHHTRMKRKWWNAIIFAIKYLDAVMDSVNPTIFVHPLPAHVENLIRDIIKLIAIQIDHDERPVQMPQLYKLLHNLLQAPELEVSNSSPVSLPTSLNIITITHQYLAHTNGCFRNDGEILMQAFELAFSQWQRARECKTATESVILKLLRQIASCVFGITHDDGLHPSVTRPPKENNERFSQVFEIFLPTYPTTRGTTAKPTSLSEEIFAKAINFIKHLPEADREILHLRRDTMAQYLHGSRNQAPEWQGIIQTHLHPSLFQMVGDYYLQVTKEYNEAADMFLNDIVVHEPTYDTWLSLALATIRQLETKWYGTDLGNSIDKLEAMKNTILFCANKCVASDRLDDWALKLFGHFAYDFRTNTQGLAFPSDLLATQLTYFQRMKANWLSLYMQGMIIETINPLQASSHYDQALDYLWEAYGAVPSPFDHSDALLIDVRKLEVFYRLTNTIRSMVDDGNSSIDATARLKKQLQRFEPNCSVRRWSNKMLIIRCFEICALINRSHKDAVYQLANIYLNSDGQCRDESVAERLLMGTYQTYSADTIPGLFAEQQPENFFHSFVPSICDEINRPGSFARSTSNCVKLLLQYFEQNSRYIDCLQTALKLQNITADKGYQYVTDVDRIQLISTALEYTIDIASNRLDSLSIRDGNAGGRIQALRLLNELYELHTHFRHHVIETESGKITSFFLKGYFIYNNILDAIEKFMTDEQAYADAIRLASGIKSS